MAHDHAFLSNQLALPPSQRDWLALLQAYNIVNPARQLASTTCATCRLKINSWLTDAVGVSNGTPTRNTTRESPHHRKNNKNMKTTYRFSEAAIQGYAKGTYTAFRVPGSGDIIIPTNDPKSGPSQALLRELYDSGAHEGLIEAIEEDGGEDDGEEPRAPKGRKPRTRKEQEDKNNAQAVADGEAESDRE